MPSIAGKLLVASRQLRDSNFARTVVLMLEHSAEGALGVVLNRPSPQTVQQVWESLGDFGCQNSELVHLGGPVPGPLIALHTAEELAEKEVLPGLLMSVQKEALEQLVRMPEANARLYSGHSGWGPGQLESELEAGGWLTTAAQVEDIFGNAEATETLWQRVLGRISLEIMLPGISPDKLPPDPTWN